MLNFKSQFTSADVLNGEPKVTTPRPRHQPKPIKSWTVDSVKQKRRENGLIISPRVLYNANRTTFPVKYSVGGEWIIKECEEHTSWINKVLKRHKYRPVSDLRKAISDSLTLVNLVEILANEKLPGIQTKPIIRAQKAENIRQCLNLLKKKRTEIDVDAEDLADGSLKAVLDLVSNIRKRFDKSATNGLLTTESYDRASPVSLRPASSKLIRTQDDTISTQSYNSLSSFKRPDSVATYQSQDSFDFRLNQSLPATMNIVSEPILPGTMSLKNQEEIIPVIIKRTDKLMSTTQLDSRGVSQHGAEVRREQLTREKSHKYSVRPEPRKTRLTAWSNAKQNIKSKSPVREVLTMTVENRLKTLLDNPAPGNTNYQSYPDGELIQPPPPKERWNYGYVDEDEDENNNMDDENKINDMLDNPNKFKNQSDWDRYVTGYVPSHAEDKLEGPRAQALLDRPKISPREETPTPRPDPLFKSPPSQHMGLNRNDNNVPGYYSSNVPNQSGEVQHQHRSWYSPNHTAGMHYQQKNSSPYSADNVYSQKHLPSYEEHISKHTPEVQRKMTSMTPDRWWKEYEEEQQNYNAPSDPQHHWNTDSCKENNGPDKGQDKKRKLPFVSQVINQSDFDDSKMARLLQRRSSMQARIAFYDDPKYNSNKTISDVDNLMAKPQYTSTPFSMLSKLPSDIKTKRDQSYNAGQTFYNKDSTEFELNYEPSECSSRSNTPPLPQLSPGNTPPSSANSSPIVGRSRRSLSIGGLPESMQQRLLRLAYPDTKDEVYTKKINNSTNNDITVEEERYIMQEIARTKRNVRNRKTPSLNITPITRDTNVNRVEEEYEDQEDSASESVMDTRRTDMENSKQTADVLSDKNHLTPVSAESIRTQLLALETMYKEILQLIGAAKPTEQTTKRTIFGKRSHSKPSPRGKTKSKAGSRPSKQRDCDIKAVNKRFSRVESHVVTLARSVAHLSSELRTQSSVLREVESLRHEVNQLRDMQMMNVNELLSSPKFRPILPHCANPQRIKKLTKFFGEEPPLLAMFLKELGYHKYAINFEKEGIGMIELPYLNEDRLESIGVPAGPRLRILQEAQLIL